MIRMKSVSFESAVQNITNSVVLLDVDGTLLPDGSHELDEDTMVHAKILTSKNKVYLVSNGTDSPRVERLAVSIGAAVAPKGVPAGKPSVHAMEGITLEGKSSVVMGDKYLTDGVFAQRTGSRFVLIERKQSGKERFSVRLSYWVDRIVSWVL